MANATTTAASKQQYISLRKVLGPIHIWALGVGIVLVGEFTGWNFSMAKGGAWGAFGAGYLGALGRRDWTVVTGISTGALQGLFVAAGDYPALAKAYAIENGKRSSWRAVMLAIRTGVGDSTFGVSGVRDNCFTPSGTRCN